jgi:Cholesterol uptake porter CUP1 of Mce4, putative
VNLTLSAAAQALTGLGDKFGAAPTNGNAILDDVNPQMPQIRYDVQRLAALGDTYANASPDLWDALNHAVTTAHTLNQQQADLDAALLAAAGLGKPSMPYNEGKRCRVNQQVFGVRGAAAFEQSPKPQRQAFAAGDSDGDVTFTMDATALRLVLNRNQIELMCHAYANSDGRWLINPMFIDPLPMSPPYPCATQGFDEPNGGQAPLQRPDGSVVPDQQDRVY